MGYKKVDQKADLKAARKEYCLARMMDNRLAAHLVARSDLLRAAQTADLMAALTDSQSGVRSERESGKIKSDIRISNATKMCRPRPATCPSHA